MSRHTDVLTARRGLPAAIPVTAAPNFSMFANAHAAFWTLVWTGVAGGFSNPTNVFHDNEGVTVAGFTVTLPNDDYASWNTNNNGTLSGGLFSEWVSGSPITLSNIPYQTYDIYLYLATWNGGTGSYTIGETTLELDQQYDLVKPQAFGTLGFQDGKNFVKFTGLSGLTQTITATYGVSAFQILATTVGTPASGYASWAGANGISLNPSDDSNNDGVANGVAYFMNVTGLATNPGINGITKQVTWPNGGKINSDQYGIQFVVQTSSDLQTWTDVPVENLDANTDAVVSPPSDGSLSCILKDPSPRFVRLKVTPN
jgi:hypothetical protein